MTIKQLHTFLETALQLNCGDYEILFMLDERYPHSVSSATLDHTGTTLDLHPYQDNEE